jgi:hypothetical protein
MLGHFSRFTPSGEDLSMTGKQIGRAAAWAVMLCTGALAAAPALAAASPSPCADAKHHQFDFWVGKWDVYDRKNKKVAHSLIEKVYGCGVRENWMPFDHQPGGSLNIYAPDTKRWEQFWIDSQGSRAIFTGGWNGKAMVISGRWGRPLVRITYTKQPDGSVRQFGEASLDQGKSWKPSFDLLYRHAVGW